MFGSSLYDILVLAIVLLFIVLRIKYEYTYWTRKGVPQIPPVFPFGNVKGTICRRKHPTEIILDYYKLMKSQGHRYVGLYVTVKKTFLVIDPKIAKYILTKGFNHFNGRGVPIDEENDPMAANMLTLSGKKWKSIRHKLAPTFTSGKLKAMCKSIVDCTDELFNVLSESATKAEPVEMKDVLARFTIDVIGLWGFGIKCNGLKNTDAEFRKYGRITFENRSPLQTFKYILLRIWPKVGKFFKVRLTSKDVTTFFTKVVIDTIRYREENDVSRNDFLQLLLDLEKKKNENEGLTAQQVISQSFMFFLAGFETSSTTMTFCVHQLCCNPDVQEKAREEILKVLKKYGGEVTYDGLMEMHYLEKVILETLRKYPPVALLLRQCNEDYKIPDTNVVIDKGTMVVVPAVAYQRDEQYFPNPEKFDPERFSEENKAKIEEYTYLPFGEGPRICIGVRFSMIEAKIGLVALLKDFRFKLNEKTGRTLKIETTNIIYTPIALWVDITKI